VNVTHAADVAEAEGAVAEVAPQAPATAHAEPAAATHAGDAVVTPLPMQAAPVATPLPETEAPAAPVEAREPTPAIPAEAPIAAAEPAPEVVPHAEPLPAAAEAALERIPVEATPAALGAVEQPAAAAAEPVSAVSGGALSDPNVAAKLAPTHAEPAIETPAAAAQPTAVAEEPAQRQAAAETTSAAAPAKRANGLSVGDLQPMLESAGLVWVSTDAEKLRSAQEAAARIAPPARAPRERKPLPPVDTTPMQQIETRKSE
jgi:ribonuclease E